MFNQDSILVNMLVKNVFIPEKKLLNKSSPGLNKTWPLTLRENQSTEVNKYN